MFFNKEALRVLSLFTTHDASNDFFLINSKQRPYLGLFWVDQEKTRPIPNLSTAISQSETNQCRNRATLLNGVLILKKGSFLTISVVC